MLKQDASYITGSQMHLSTSNLGVGSSNISSKITNSKVLAHLRFKSKVLPGPLTDLSAWVGFYTSFPEMGVIFQLRYWRMGYINISCKIPNGKVLAHYGPLTDLTASVGFSTLSQHVCFKFQLRYWMGAL